MYRKLSEIYKFVLLAPHKSVEKCALFVDYKFRKLYDEINLIT